MPYLKSSFRIPLMLFITQKHILLSPHINVHEFSFTVKHQTIMQANTKAYTGQFNKYIQRHIS